MAGLIDRLQQSANTSQDLVQIVRNPMFPDLQKMLEADCSRHAVPYSLMQPEQSPVPSWNRISRDTETDKENDTGSVDLQVEEATLQAEFRQLAPLKNHKVSELESFYNTQTAALLTQRMDAVGKIQQACLPPDRLQQELTCVSSYYANQQVHLTLRVSKSLQLLKCTLPTELAQPGGATKRSRTRLLNSKAVKCMTEWYEQHIDNPYPTDQEKQEMANLGNITLAQVKAWFANKRNRSANTKPKRQKHRLQQHLRTICDALKPSVPTDMPASMVKSDRNQNYGMLIGNLADLVTDRTETFTGMTPPCIQVSQLNMA